MVKRVEYDKHNLIFRCEFCKKHIPSNDRYWRAHNIEGFLTQFCEDCILRAVYDIGYMPVRRSFIRQLIGMSIAKVEDDIRVNKRLAVPQYITKYCHGWQALLNWLASGITLDQGVDTPDPPVV